MEEKSFYEGEGVKVTNARIVFPGETYAMGGLSSVEMLKESPSKKVPIILIVISLIMFLGGGMQGGGSFTGLAALFLLSGIVILFFNKPTYWVVLQNASGRKRAYGNKEVDSIHAIVEAINSAIVFRG